MFKSYKEVRRIVIQFLELYTKRADDPFILSEAASVQKLYRELMFPYRAVLVLLLLVGIVVIIALLHIA